MHAKVTVLDGAMGTRLQLMGLKSGETPEDWNVDFPERVLEVHRKYVEAGADIVYANTFGASSVKYHGKYDVAKVIDAGVKLAKAAGAKVALDVGPSGRLLKPAGDFPFEAAVENFAEVVRAGATAGADLVVIETMTDTLELKAAVIAAKENCKLPVYATVALQENGTLLTGGNVESVAAMLEGLGVDAYGFNCGLGPDLMLPYVERLAKVSTKPIIVKPNAGLPKVVDGKTRFTVEPAEFAAQVERLVKAGAEIVGGCCGTTPEHIRAVARFESAWREKKATGRTVVSSGSRTVEISQDDTVIIGERINPTGKKKLKAAYQAGDTAYILREAIAQVEAGAAILDVNAGVPGIDEPKTLADTVEAIQAVTDIPLQIDTSDPAALERALRRYNGKALVNSVNGKRETMDAVFPLVKKYGGVVVALTLDENGIPATAEGRLAIARRILAEGAKYGLTRDDFLIDVLCLAVSADAQSANTILESLVRVRKELGCRTVLGVSNISFGLPARAQVNSSFYTLALGAGLSAAIVNPLSPEMMGAYRAWRALTGRDRGCGEWIAASSEVAPAPVRSEERTVELSASIRRGLAADAGKIAAEMLSAGSEPMAIINGEIVPALEEVGRLFESGKLYLPQLLMSADAAGEAFKSVKAAMKGVPGVNSSPIVIATVKGDIHDIGKNIVRALLENHGFSVIDLGRDVAPEDIVAAALRAKSKLVGLSALMTTTVKAMEETIRALKAADPSIRVFVGGAVITAEYAAEIGADYYTKDAMASVRLAKELNSKLQS